VHLGGRARNGQTAPKEDEKAARAPSRQVGLHSLLAAWRLGGSLALVRARGVQWGADVERAERRAEPREGADADRPRSHRDARGRARGLRAPGAGGRARARRSAPTTGPWCGAASSAVGPARRAATCSGPAWA
jgi:hypothetical protein